MIGSAQIYIAHPTPAQAIIDAAQMGLTKGVVIAIKLLISAALTWAAFSNVDVSTAALSMRDLRPSIAIVAVAIIFVQFLIGCVRQVVILSMFGHDIRFGQSLNAVLIGAFFSQTFISFLGGDAMRIWQFKETGMPLRNATGAIMLDRIIGIFSIFAIVAACSPAALGLVGDSLMQWGLLTLLAGGGFALLAFLLLGLAPDRVRYFRYIGPLLDMMSIGRYVLALPRQSLYAFVSSILVQLINVVAIFVIASGIGATISLWQCMVLVPPVLLMAMLPISVAGWGVRESARPCQKFCV